MRIVLLALLVGFIAGCGGSGGGSTLDPAPTTGPTTATVEVSTQGPSPDTVIYSAEFTLHLPAGVTVAADSATGEVSSQALQAIDGGAIVMGKYVPATADSQGTVKVMIVDSGGFPVGKLATLACNIAPGTSVSAAGFSIDGFSTFDLNGTAVPGITASFGVKTQ